MTGELAARYKSGAQRARVVTEAWGESNLYCPNCTSPKLDRLEHNTKTIDFSCPKCSFRYQLKSQKSPIRSSISDGAYESMMDAIRHDRTPNFYLLQYELATWSIKNMLLIPHFAFPPSAIIKRKPLSITAQRHGWVGCSIDLGRIPAEARIAVVTNREALSPKEVRARYRRVKPLEDIPVSLRGWTLDVLTAVRSLGKPEFTNEDAYTLTTKLEKLHPGNRHIRDKIRQQLQVLRDAGLHLHLQPGHWRIP